jgi:N6-adenosine-specific RNA methylase IME4
LHTKPEGHSKKPEDVQDRIEALMPNARRLELFATRTRPGWDTVGLALDPAHDVRSPEFWDVLRRTAEGPPPLLPEDVRPALD